MGVGKNTKSDKKKILESLSKKKTKILERGIKPTVNLFSTLARPMRTAREREEIAGDAEPVQLIE